MSDDYIIIISEMPAYVPDRKTQKKAIAYFQSILGSGTLVSVVLHDEIQFVDCGSNFTSVKCPSCIKDLDIEIWQKWMDMDFVGKGFNLNLHKMSCCTSSYTLHDLKYNFAQGFAKFELLAQNPNIGYLSENYINEFSKIFGHPVRVIYRHL